jgi:hypothetical protein
MPPGVDPRMPTTSATEKYRADFGLDIPTELCPLPSNGLVYPPSHPFHNQETVQIRGMTAREEDILTSKVHLKKGTVITELIKSCLVDKSVNPADLLAGDRVALMVAIRITGYGQEYDVELECDQCEAKTHRTFDLAALPIQRLATPPVTEGVNAFKFLLPFTKKEVTFRFMTGRDEEEMVATAEKMKKLGMNNETGVTTSLMHSILTVDGIDDRQKIANFVKNMPARDSTSLRNYIKSIEPGMLMKQETTCPSCGHSEEVSMPLGISFLWPSAAR